jgi:hypothetical protein
MAQFGLIAMVAVMMLMAMRKGADSPSPILAAIRVKKDR